ncbi:makorin [Anopheles sinensis]|uniref:RING-type E3 ubiquitin transferase n=1 Tax=Anopheles sinensis TaxID=74873 RepID=A0A084VFS3_ANOSI|nr:makorin [Anopheles sinensis]
MDAEGRNGSEQASPLNSAPARVMCKFHLRGRCRHGTACQFLHLPRHDPETILPEHSTQKAKVDIGPSAGNTVKAPATSLDLSKWIDAPVFVPKSRLSAEICQSDDKVQKGNSKDKDDEKDTNETDDGGGACSLSYASIVTAHNNHNGIAVSLLRPPSAPLCVDFLNTGVCVDENCNRLHGLRCELCDKFCLHPDDPGQRQQHTADCIKQHEQDMEHSFAVQRSRDKTCGICLETVLEKRPREQRFGILPNCKHIFCLSCIRTWRKADNFANKIKRGCPTCRIASDFVCPSYVWIETDDEKKKLIDDYKLACSGTDCMHFKKGAAKCPFGNKCFYRHALANGELIDVGAPPRRRVQNRRPNRGGWIMEELFEFLGPRHTIVDEFAITYVTDDDDSDFDDFDMYDMDYDFGVFRGSGGYDSDEEVLHIRIS